MIEANTAVGVVSCKNPLFVVNYVREGNRRFFELALQQKRFGMDENHESNHQ